MSMHKRCWVKSEHAGVLPYGMMQLPSGTVQALCWAHCCLYCRAATVVEHEAIHYWRRQLVPLEHRRNGRACSGASIRGADHGQMPHRGIC